MNVVESNLCATWIACNGWLLCPIYSSFHSFSFVFVLPTIRLAHCRFQRWQIKLFDRVDGSISQMWLMKISTDTWLNLNWCWFELNASANEIDVCVCLFERCLFCHMAQVSNTTFIFIFVIIISAFILCTRHYDTTPSWNRIRFTAESNDSLECYSIQIYICVCKRKLDVMIFTEPRETHLHCFGWNDLIFWRNKHTHTHCATLSSVILLFLSLVYGFVLVLWPGNLNTNIFASCLTVRIWYIFHIRIWFIFGFPSIFIVRRARKINKFGKICLCALVRRQISFMSCKLNTQCTQLNIRVTMSTYHPVVLSRSYSRSVRSSRLFYHCLI